MEEQFNREAKEGWSFAADAVRIIDERAGNEDRKHMLERVFVAVDSNLGSSCGDQKKERLIRSQVTKEESPKHGSMSQEVCVFSRCTSGTRKDGPKE